jgi:hypothetical protein
MKQSDTDPMTALEHRKSDSPSTVAKRGAFHLPSCPESVNTIANLSTESLDAVRVLVHALVKEYARPYETVRDRVA